MAVDRVQIIFAAAAGLNDPAVRAALLDRECGDDVALRRRVEHLLKAHDDSGGLPDAAPTGFFDAGIREGAVVAGRYKLFELIGEGGMGAVWLAEQTEPVKRKVALKLVKPGMDSKAVLARFEAERQALALMDHPNIARVHDGGATEQGRPYFVMELVKGLPLTEYCDARRMSVRERLDLFVQICSAVQHAHQKGIIHRDLKPSNILVTEHDGRPVPKVIDFGLAKALGAATTLTERTLHTAFGTVVGTPLYMAPEQVAVNALDVDTRSDIYSLGVILYELLTGTTPLEKLRFKEAAWEEVRRVIREEEPPKPSARLSDSHDSLPSISAQRHTEPAALTKLVRGELDWIVMKALEKDRNRRYETANGFSMDVQRYLAGEVVQACPPSAAYRFKKFVRRNKGPVVAASLVFVALVAAVVGTSWGLVKAKAAAVREAKAKERAETNFALAGEAVGKYLSEVTDDPQLLQADFFALRKRLLESALPFLEKIVQEQGDDPAFEAQRGLAFTRLTHVHRATGDYEATRQAAEETHAIFGRLLAEDPANQHYRHRLAQSLINRATAVYRMGRHADAVPFYREAIVHLERVVQAVPALEARQELAETHRELGHLLDQLGERTGAKAAMRRSVEIERMLIAEFPDQPSCRQRLARSYGMLGRFLLNRENAPEARTLFQDAADILERLAAQFPRDAFKRHDYSAAVKDLYELHLQFGKRQEAEAFLRQALKLKERLAGEFPTMPEIQWSLAVTLQELGAMRVRDHDYKEAETYLHRALSIDEKLTADLPTVPEYQQSLAQTVEVLGSLYKRRGKAGDAEAAYQRSLAIKEKLAKDHPNLWVFQVMPAGAYCNRGIMLAQSGRPDEALPWFEKATAGLEAVLSKNPQALLALEYLRNTHGAKGDALQSLGRRADATQSREQVLRLDKILIGSDRPETLRHTRALIDDYDALGRFEDSLKLREEVLEVRRRTLPPNHSDLLGAMANVAVGYANLGRHQEAIKRQEEVVALMKATMPGQDFTLRTTGALSDSYAAVDRHSDSKRTLDEGLAAVRSKLAARDTLILPTAYYYAAKLIKRNRGSEGVALIDESVRHAAGKDVPSDILPSLLDLRLRHFQKKNDPAGVRATAEMWERLNRTDADSLYDAACMRAVAAVVARAAGGPNDAKSAVAEADRAMEWLRKAASAGFANAAHMKQDSDLDSLRERDDFKKLIAEMEAKRK